MGSSVGPSSIQPRAEAARLEAGDDMVEVGPGEQTSVFVNVCCEEGEATDVGDLSRCRDTRRRVRLVARIGDCAASNGLFDEVACRATSDVHADHADRSRPLSVCGNSVV